MSYAPVTLTEALHIDHLYTIHYFEYSADFLFEGEAHDFWEFVCVDKGSVEISMDGQKHILRKNDIAFHKPNEFHEVSTRGHAAPNLVVVSFKCNSPLMDFFQNRILKIDEKERAILADIIKEAQTVFSSPLNDPYLTEMQKKSDLPLGAEQLIRMQLEYFLIHLARRFMKPTQETIDLPVLKEGSDVFKRVVTYMENNLSSNLSIAQICKDNAIGHTNLQAIFTSEASAGVIEYFIGLKIDAAKQMMRQGTLNFTEIADYLGYSSIYYFSRQFKKVTGMTPSEYVSSIKAIVEKNRAN